MIDLRQTIKIQKLHPERKYHIGIITDSYPKEFNGMGRKSGDVVLFRPTSKKDCTIEIPKSDEWIKKSLAEGNFIDTIGTCVGFPLKYIEEVLV